jgi:nicotinamide mononucleotide adenylyltransferase
MTQRVADKTKTTVVPLKELQERVPRTVDGDPAFHSITANDEKWFHNVEVGDDSVLSVFTPAQIVVIVNRWIYQAEYQQQSHRQRSQEIRDREKPVKEAFKQMFPNTSFINATEEQIQAAIRVAYPPREEEKKK